MSIASLLCVITSCTKNESEVQITPQIPYSIPCLEWKAEKNRVIKYMNGFNLKDEEPNYLYYDGKKIENLVSYQFQNDELCTVSLTIPNSSTSLADLKYTFNTYVYLGEINGVLVFVNEVENTVATISTFIKDNALYYALGWGQLYP